MEQTNIQTENDRREVERIKAGLQEMFGQSVSITFEPVMHLFDGETEPRPMGYGYRIELETAVHGRQQLASCFSTSGLLAFWEGINFGFFYGQMTRHEIEREYDETAISQFESNNFSDCPF